MSDFTGLIGIVALFFGYLATLIAVAFGIGTFAQRFGRVALVPFVLSPIGGGLMMWWRLSLGETFGDMTLLRWASWFVYGALILFAVEALVGWGLWVRSRCVKRISQKIAEPGTCSGQ